MPYNLLFCALFTTQSNMNLFFLILPVNSELTQNNLILEPTFTQPIENVSVAMGREVVLSCYVENLQHYKVGWMRAADQTVLALQGRVVTHNSRYSVANEEMRVWRLKINNIRETDRGCYMYCIIIFRIGSLNFHKILSRLFPFLVSGVRSTQHH
jgi:hypothetical protein